QAWRDQQAHDFEDVVGLVPVRNRLDVFHTDEQVQPDALAVLRSERGERIERVGGSLAIELHAAALELVGIGGGGGDNHLPARLFIENIVLLVRRLTVGDQQN